MSENSEDKDRQLFESYLNSSKIPKESDENNYIEFKKYLSKNNNSIRNRNAAEADIDVTSKKMLAYSTDKDDKKNNKNNENILYNQFEAYINKTPVDSTFHKNIDTDNSRKKHHRKKINKSQINPEDKLDLHGDTQEIAKSRLGNFLHKSISRGYKQVLVVHGKGLHSEYGKSVLRDVVECYAKTDGKHLIKSMQEAPVNFGGSGAKIISL